jgi:hypothetical protein
MDHLLGYLPIAAAAFAIPQFLPQLVRLRVTGDTAGVSWSWATLTSVNNGAWFGYFILSGYWTAMLPSSAAAILAGGIATTLALRGRASWRAATLICGWAALLITGSAVAGRVGLGTLLAGAFIVQVAPSLWTAYRTERPTGLAYGTWLLIFGELSCWLAFGLHRSDPRLIVLGTAGVTASVLMLARIWRTSSKPTGGLAWAWRRSGARRPIAAPGPRSQE